MSGDQGDDKRAANPTSARTFRSAFALKPNMMSRPVASAPTPQPAPIPESPPVSSVPVPPTHPTPAAEIARPPASLRFPNLNLSRGQTPDNLAPAAVRLVSPQPSMASAATPRPSVGSAALNAIIYPETNAPAASAAGAPHPIALATTAAARPLSKPGVSVVASRLKPALSLPSVEIDETEETKTFRVERVNATQVRYRPMSKVNPTGAVAPESMAHAMHSALERLVAKHGDIDDWLCHRLRWTKQELGSYLTSEQVDGLALALDAADRREGMIIADQTGFGKGRILAALARAVSLSGRTNIFMTEKANLFSDIWRDIRDINSEKQFGRPFILNANVKIVDTSSVDGTVLVPALKKAEVDRALAAGALPPGTKIMMPTYSQFNRKGTRKTALLESVANGGHVILDESHNFVGDSTTSQTVGAAIAVASGSTFSSATFARDVTNLAAYSSVFPWLKKIPGLDEMSPWQRKAIAEESVRCATDAGRIIRREHDLTNMVLRVHSASGERLKTNQDLADRLAPILSQMAKLSARVGAILESRNEANRQLLEGLPSADERKAEREVWATANFGSRLGAVLQQFLVALNVDPCVEMCVQSLKDGKRPVVVIEATMESLMRELTADNDVGDTDELPDEQEPPQASLDLGDPDAADPVEKQPETLKPPTFQDALMLLADRLIKVSVRRGANNNVKEVVELDEPGLAHARDAVMALAKDFPQLSLSPIDDIRDRVEAAGRELAAKGLISKPWIADEISARGMRVAEGRYVNLPPADRNLVVARFVNGMTHMLVLTQAASTGLSIHDSEKFAEHAQRHMIELSPPRNVLARIQMWGRVWRRGQLTEPDFTVLDTGLPFHSYDLAVRNRKLSELSASVTGTSKATVALDVADPVDPVGNEVAYEMLQEQHALGDAMGISLNVDKEKADREHYFVRKLFMRSPLITTAKSERVIRSFYERYHDRLKAGADAQAGRHLDGQWRPISRAILEAGDGSDDPVTGRDVTVTTLQAERMATPMKSPAIQKLIAAAVEAQAGQPKPADYVRRISDMAPSILEAALPRKRLASVKIALESREDNPVKKAKVKLLDMIAILTDLRPGVAAKLPGDEDELVDAIIVAYHLPPLERANVGREYVIQFLVPGEEKIRTVSLDAVVRDRRTCVYPTTPITKLLAACDAAPVGRVTIERKVLDGNVIGAVLAGRRLGSGTRTSYVDAAGHTRTGILLPRNLENRMAGVPGRTNLPAVAAHILAQGATLQTDPLRPVEGVSIRPDPKGTGIVVTIPSNKRMAKPFETKDLLALTGEFTGDFRGREAHVPMRLVMPVLELLAQGGREFHFHATHREEVVRVTQQIVAANNIGKFAFSKENSTRQMAYS